MVVESRCVARMGSTGDIITYAYDNEGRRTNKFMNGILRQTTYYHTDKSIHITDINGKGNTKDRRLYGNVEEGPRLITTDSTKITIDYDIRYNTISEHTTKYGEGRDNLVSAVSYYPVYENGQLVSIKSPDCEIDPLTIPYYDNNITDQ